MTGGGTHKDPRPAGVGPGTAELLEDWITIWQSELAAVILDRETQDTLLRLVDGWAAHATAAVALLAGPHDPSGPAGANAQAGPAAVAAAPAVAAAADRRDALIEHLLARVSELERRLAKPGAGGAA